LEQRNLLTFAGTVGRLDFVEGVQHGTQVANIVASNMATATPSSFTVSIDWGDGVTTPGMVTGGNGYFSAAATHTYAQDGNFTVTVTVQEAGVAQPATTTDPAFVDSAELFAAGVGTINATHGVRLDSAVANMTDLGDDPAGEFVAVVDWGDGTGPTGVDTNGHPLGAAAVVVGGNGNGGYYSALASHTYADPGNYTVTVSVWEVGTSQTVKATSPVVVS
jgi:PKD repeat protein